MRKFLLAILAVFYLIISVGFIKYDIYCQDRLMKTTIVKDDHSCKQCIDCAQEMCRTDKKCCEHSMEHVQLKVDQNHSYSHTDITFQQIAIVEVFLFKYIFAEANAVKEKSLATDAPPLGVQSPIYILNCTYRI